MVRKHIIDILGLVLQENSLVILISLIGYILAKLTNGQIFVGKAFLEMILIVVFILGFRYFLGGGLEFWHVDLILIILVLLAESCVSLVSLTCLIFLFARRNNRFISFSYFYGFIVFVIPRHHIRRLPISKKMKLG